MSIAVVCGLLSMSLAMSHVIEPVRLRRNAILCRVLSDDYLAQKGRWDDGGRKPMNDYAREMVRRQCNQDWQP